MLAQVAAERLVNKLANAVSRGEVDLFSALDSLPDAIYVTNADGIVVYYNQA